MEEASGVDRPIVVVGLLADPGLPADLARAMAQELPALLARHITDRECWKVELLVGEIGLEPDGRLPLIETSRRTKAAQQWDYLVCLTDLPRRTEGRTIAADISTVHGAALVSVPAVGWLRRRRQVHSTVVHALSVLAAQNRSGTARPRARFSPLKQVVSEDADIDCHLVLTGWRGRTRLLLGMVHANRPWRLVPSLSKAIAAAMGAAAFGIFYPSIWKMADALSPARLMSISLFAVLALAFWLIVHNGLWERPRRRENRRDGRLYNTATALTLLTGGTCMYLVLFAATLLAALAVISSDYLSRQLGHAAALSDYLTLAWLSSSMGTVAGALGSSLETEDAVRQATYSEREQQRRARRSQEEHDEEQEEEAHER